jgi:hypothetical protein
MVGVKWLNGTPTILAQPTGAGNYKAVAVSGDGNMIGGLASISGFNIPILWTGTAAPEQLLQVGTTSPVQNGVTFNAEITGISRDGSVIAAIGGRGQQWGANGTIVGPNVQALRWTRATGFVELGFLPAIPPPARAVGRTTFRPMAEQSSAIRSRAASWATTCSERQPDRHQVDPGGRHGRLAKANQSGRIRCLRSECRRQRHRR